ncbi:MAG: ATP-binding protein [Pseudomonadota bacterium]
MLHLICGKIASGKSTLAAELASAPQTILVSEDEWLSALFADQLETPKDYVRCAAKLRTVMSPHLVALLRAGLSVVLDFPANTMDQRRWMRTIIDESSAPHQLHFLDVPDAVCLERLRARNAQGAHKFAVTEAQFHQISKHFVAPQPHEGFTLVRP